MNGPRDSELRAPRTRVLDSAGWLAAAAGAAIFVANLWIINPSWFQRDLLAFALIAWGLSLRRGSARAAIAASIFLGACGVMLALRAADRSGGLLAPHARVPVLWGYGAYYDVTERAWRFAQDAWAADVLAALIIFAGLALAVVRRREFARPRAASESPGAASMGATARWAVPAITLVFFGVFLVYPLADAFIRVFIHEKTGAFSMDLLESEVLNNCEVYARDFANSKQIAFTATALCLAATLPVAILFGRFRFPGAGVLPALVILPMVLPPFVGAVGLKKLVDRGGMIESLLHDIGLLAPGQSVDIFGSGEAFKFWGVVVMMTLHLYPIMLLNLTAALARVDRSMEEAALNLGASRPRAFLSVSLPLALPGLFAGAAIVFISAFTDLGTPLVFNYDNVAASKLFSLAERDDARLASAVVMLMLVYSVLFFDLGRRALGTRQTASGKGTARTEKRVAPPALWVPVVIFFLILTFLAILPHAVVAIRAFAPPDWEGTFLPGAYSSNNFSEAWDAPFTASSIRNSLRLSIGSTLIDIALGVAIAWYAARSKNTLGRILDGASMLPLAVPGLLVAVGYLVCFQNTFLLPGEKHGGTWLVGRFDPSLLLVLAYSLRRLPYTARTAAAGFMSVPPSLEEASMNLGAGHWRTLRKVTLPLMGPFLAAGAVMAFTFAMLEVSDSLILATREEHYPLAKALYRLLSTSTGDLGPACALGLFGMGLLTFSLLWVGMLMGKKAGDIFRM
jgi:iron(III) transport system permease protein